MSYAERDAVIESYERAAHSYRAEIEELRREVERQRREASRVTAVDVRVSLGDRRDWGGLEALDAADALREARLEATIKAAKEGITSAPITKPDGPRALSVRAVVTELRRILGAIDDLACKSGPIRGSGEEEPDPLNPDGQEIAEHCREALALLPVDF